MKASYIIARLTKPGVFPTCSGFFCQTPFPTGEAMSRSAFEDARAVCGSIYRMNAQSAIGYLFNPTEDGKAVATGMFCHRLSEINPDH